MEKKKQIDLLFYFILRTQLVLNFAFFADMK